MKILNNDKILKIILPTMLMIALALGCVKTDATESKEKQIDIEQNKVNVLYNTHIQNDGWEKDFSKKNGDTSGTSGRSLRLEAIKIKLDNLKDVSIKYQTHIQNVGWQDWKKNGEMAGTSGQALRLEGIRIQLENSDEYSVQYRVHVQNIGWQDWKTDGEMAGTEGQSLRLEAIEIKITKKKAKALLQVDTDIKNTTFDKKGINISGWKLSTEADTKLEVYIDNSKMDDKYIKYSYKYNLTSIVKGFGTKEENPKPNYDINIPAMVISDGKHNLKIKMLTKNAEVLKEVNEILNIDKKSKTILNIDTELNNKTFNSEKILIQGWKLSTEKDSKLMVMIDDKKIDDKYITNSYKYNLTAIVKGYGTSVENPKPNFDISIPVNIISDGKHKLSIKVTDENENIVLTQKDFSINTNSKFFQIRIETMYNQSTITNENHIFSGWLYTSQKSEKLKLLIDGKYVENNIKRKERNDVNKYFNNAYKTENPTPGFETEINFSNYSVGLHQIALRVYDEKDNKIGEHVMYVYLKQKIKIEEGIYGKSGLAEKGDTRGSNLKYYRYGNGPNVFFATFALHGYEDNWDKDGKELVYIADKFYEKLKNEHSENFELSDKWTIYILPTVNPDGLNYGYTNNGPGRTTLYSKAPGNKGIDLNRCWKYTGFDAKTSSRNYIGTEPFQAYEAKYLKEFLQSHKSQKGQTVLVDLHGWLQQLIGDRQIGMYYAVQFPENNGYSLDKYGDGYLIDWARSALASNGKPARTALIELPDNSYNHQSVVNRKFAERYINATLSMLHGL